jgi:hypothetical protein
MKILSTNTSSTKNIRPQQLLSGVRQAIKTVKTVQ